MLRPNEANLRFCSAVVHWLAAFPSSNIHHSQPLDTLRRPTMIMSILRLLIDDSFSIDVDFAAYKDLNEGLLMNVSEVEEYESIFESVKQCFKDKLWSRKKLFKYLEMLKFDDLVVGDYFALTMLCFIFAEIGLHSFKSGIAISTISLLDEQDQEEMKQFMYDEQDLSGRNLVLMQRVNLMESENADMKKRLLASEREIVKMKKSTSSQDEEQFEELIELRDSEIIKLKQDMSLLRQQNKDLKSELAQLNDDLFTLGSLQASSSPKKSPSKRSTAIDKPSLVSHNGQVAKEGMYPELIKWEFNIMMDWVVNTIASERPSGYGLFK